MRVKVRIETKMGDFQNIHAVVLLRGAESNREAAEGTPRPQLGWCTVVLGGGSTQTGGDAPHADGLGRGHQVFIRACIRDGDSIHAVSVEMENKRLRVSLN